MGVIYGTTSHCTVAMGKVKTCFEICEIIIYMKTYDYNQCSEKIQF